jgi:putative flippase GtrA
VVVSETRSSTPVAPARARTRTGWSRWLPNKALGLRFSRFTAGSLVSTLLSQGTLTALYGWLHTSATTAGLVAFVVGAIPNFAINWKWTWGRAGRPALIKELLPYLAIIIGSGLAATALTSLTDHVLAPLVTDHGWRTLTLNAAYLASYALLFVVKFALLDKVFGKGRKKNPEPATVSSDTVSASTEDPAISTGSTAAGAQEA